MKLVIEINENEYEGIKSFPNANTSYPWTLHLYDAVRNGTPLEEYCDACTHQPTKGDNVIAYMIHKEFGCPLNECVNAYNKAVEYLRSLGKLKG